MRPLAVLALCAAAGCASPGSGPDEERPNLVLIVADDLGYGDLGCFGSATPTPALDRMAAEGLRLTDFTVTWPACTPSRGSILTGRYPLRNGLYEMIRNDEVNYGHRFTEEEYARSPEMTLGLDLREVTVGEVLRASGYATGVVGKWDGGRARRFLPLQRGFDFFYGFANTGIDYYTHERYGVPSMFRGNERVKEKGYATDLFRDEALGFIRRSRGRPFFLYLPFNAPHSASNFEKVKLQAPEESVRRFGAPDDRKAIYRAMIARLDEAVGAVFKELEALGLDRRTLVVFTSDNGGGSPTSNVPLRGSKSTLWEGGIRVPFIARWPGRIPPGRTSDALTSAMDLVPTLLSAAGVPRPTGVHLDGLDLLPLLEGKGSVSHDVLFWEHRGKRALRKGPLKWIDSGSGGVVYDLSKDVGEMQVDPALQVLHGPKLAAAWSAWRSEMEACQPRGPFRDY